MNWERQNITATLTGWLLAIVLCFGVLYAAARKRPKPVGIAPMALPTITKPAVVRKPVTNFPAFQLLFDEPAEGVAFYRVYLKHADAAPAQVWMVPASNNMVTFTLSNPKAPFQISVQAVYSNGLSSLPSSNLNWNVWSNGQVYTTSNAVWLGFMASNGMKWSVTQSPGSNTIFSVTPPSNVLEQVLLNNPEPVSYHLFKSTTN